LREYKDKSGNYDNKIGRSESSKVVAKDYISTPEKVPSREGIKGYVVRRKIIPYNPKLKKTKNVRKD